jgi:2-keto-4-pentenoate hydratase/2-oxohepta-3-ene-1,7-dioic acid hydratase in catechol pathway
MTSAAAGSGDGVTLRWPERETAHEMEIAIIIGKQGTGIPAARAGKRRGAIGKTLGDV